MATGPQGGGRRWAVIGSVIVVLLALGGTYLYFRDPTSTTVADVSSLETWLTYNGYEVLKPLRDDTPAGSLIKLNGAETLLVTSSAELFGDDAPTISRSTAPNVSWKADQKLAGESYPTMMPGLASVDSSGSGITIASIELKDLETETIPLAVVKAAVNDNDKLKDALIKSDHTMLVVVDAIRARRVECTLRAKDGGDLSRALNSERVKAAVGSNFEVTPDGKIVSSKPLYLGFKAVKRAQGSARPGSSDREIRLEQVPLGSVRRYRQEKDAKRAGKR